MIKLILYHGSLLILNLICLINLTLLLLGQKQNAIWTIIFILILNTVYIVFNKKYGSPQKEGF